MNKVEQAIKKFRADQGNERLFLEAQAEIRLSEKMTQLRLEAGLTQKELAERLDVSQAYVAKMECGGYDKCGIGTLRGIAVALGYDIAFDTMFIRQHRGYASMDQTARPIILHAPDHTSHSLSKKVIDFQSALKERVAAVG